MVSRNVRKVTLALVGNGRWGSNYIKTISSLDNCTLPEKYIVTRDYKKLVEQSDIDGVIIATPPGTHYKIAKFFLENKFNVLIEKPVTLKFSEAQKLVKLQKQNRLIGMVGHIYEYHPDFRDVKRRVNRSKVTYIYTEGLGNGPIRKDISALWDWGPHDVGICVSLMQAMPVRVACWEHSANQMYLIKLVFPGEVTSISRIGWLSPERSRTILVVEDKKPIRFCDGKNTYSKTPLAYEIEEFVECIGQKRNPLTDLSFGAKIVKILELLEKSLVSGEVPVNVS